MTPEEQKAMADRIAATRQEEAKSKIKEVHPPKTEKQAKGFVKIAINKPKTAKKVKVHPKKVLKLVKAVKKAKAPKAKKERIKPIGPATKLFKFKPGTKSREVCDVLNCREKPKKGFRCPKHRKLIRKAQLKANNKVWKKRVKEGSAGHHVVYTRPGLKTQATRFSLKASDKAEGVVKSGHSIITKVGEFKEILARTKGLKKAKAAKKKAA